MSCEAVQVLFLVKNGGCYGCYSDGSVSSGLFNSVLALVESLRRLGFRVVFEVVIDGNCVDKLIHQHKPALVILEAIWCPPYKVKENKKLHPGVKWICRVHSEIPFLANEGQAIGWLEEYRKLGVELAFNSERTAKDFRGLYLPNIYEQVK